MPDAIRVVDWISYEEAETKEDHCGGMGGWFSEGHTWADYAALYSEETLPYLEAIRDDVLASGRFLCGNEHQELDTGTPLFSDGTVGSFSYRGWGDLMAAIATIHDGKPHHYMEFYMGGW